MLQHLASNKVCPTVRAVGVPSIKWRGMVRIHIQISLNKLVVTKPLG